MEEGRWGGVRERDGSEMCYFITVDACDGRDVKRQWLFSLDGKKKGRMTDVHTSALRTETAPLHRRPAREDTRCKNEVKSSCEINRDGRESDFEAGMSLTGVTGARHAKMCK